MSVTLSIENFGSLNLLESSQLAIDVTAGSNKITLDTSQDINANDFIYIGRQSSEAAELVKVYGVIGQEVTLLSNLISDHTAFESVSKLFGDKIKIYTAPNVDGLPPADSAFAPLSGGLILLDVDQAQTYFTDASGTNNIWYKFTFFNSDTSTETSLADTTATRGGGANNYCSLDAIRTESGLKGRYVTDGMIERKRRAAQSEIDGSLVGLYYVPFSEPINDFISDLTSRLAAGLLLTEQFGIYNTTNTNNGEAKLKEARAQLKQLQTGQMSLVGVTGIDQEIPGTGGFSGWPNETTNGTSGDLSGDNGPDFRRSMRY